jgi:anti-sigma factor (TIGR02949 family)
VTDRKPEKNACCGRFARDLYHFQAGELPEEAMEAMAEHAEACPPCGRRLEVEQGLLRGIQSRLERAEAPPELRVRVREALEAEAAPSGLSGWLRAPWLLPAAVALVLAFALWPLIPQIASVTRVDQRVVLVDLECERAGKTIEQQRRCTHPKHFNALRVADGRYWHIGLDRTAGREIVSAIELRGHRLRVEGELDERSETLHLARYTDEGREPLMAARLSGH